MSEAAPDPHAQPAPGGSRAVLLALASAGVVLVAVLLLTFRGAGSPEFPGGEALAGIIRAAHNFEAEAFGPAGATMGEVGDGLLAAGFSGYRVPAGLEGAAVRGGLVDKTGATPVAVLRLGESGMRAVVFPPAPFGIGLPDDGSWVVYELPPGRGAPRLGVALQTREGVCVALSSPEGTAAVRRWLAVREIEAD